MAELDNANPTILNASQLPTREVKAAPRNGPDAKFNGAIFAKPSYLSQPFYVEGLSWGQDAAEDDLAVEAIDEQEIYGESLYVINVRCFPADQNERPDRADYRPRTPRFAWPAL